MLNGVFLYSSLRMQTHITHTHSAVTVHLRQALPRIKVFTAIPRSRSVQFPAGIMWGRLLVLSLFAFGCRASDFLGTGMTYAPLSDYTVCTLRVFLDLNPGKKGRAARGTSLSCFKKNNTCSQVAVSYKMSFRNECILTNWTCQLGDCGAISLVTITKVFEILGGCRLDVVTHHHVSQISKFVLRLDGLRWINVTNDVTEALAVAHVDLRTRSDTGRANASPRTAVLPVLRVPSNCQRYVTLTTFDPDGDVVKCRYQNATSVLQLSPVSEPRKQKGLFSLPLNIGNFSPPLQDCTMSFTPRGNDSDVAEGAYAIQLIVEDFPHQNITLTDGKGIQTPVTGKDAIGQIPVQFVLMVDPPAASCVEGEHLPAFRPPTPANGERVHGSVNESLEIPINVEVNQQALALFSGPSDMQLNVSDGHLFLTWKPTERDSGQSQPACFVIQLFEEGLTPHQSEMRCVIVTVDPVVIVVTARLLSGFPLSVDNFQGAALTQLKKELVARGLPAGITLRVVSFREESGDGGF
ncbi:uncharacterized protein LOC133494804 isoform X2 [Syngnathoides biaculeatus]|uniref:uncharacterized protein LOC133494804 isoform X2 n=1 Tax=Syngnathoides biaculeatus TaxID=300417 RepID=UPI002ADDFEE3|nr:uncharacterized protein LOC133494804 isoform X2 [Syngnathoides biaculeatus]